jgi:molybdopterin-guanine dinucleotide biosynthesis protein A
MRVLGIVLAGGDARRMGGVDKCLLEIGGQTILALIIARLSLQVEKLALNANGDPARFARFKLAVVPDLISLQGEGPLAGVLTGLQWLEAQGADALLSVPGDTPFLPRALVSTLAEAMERQNTICAFASSQGQPHPVIALWTLPCKALIETALRNGERKVRSVLQKLGAVNVAFDNAGDMSFHGANTPDELEALRGAKLRSD